jgi:hypothetical protein
MEPRDTSWKGIGLAVWIALAMTAPLSVLAFPFQATTVHPRVFLRPSEIPTVAARVGVSDTGIPPVLIRSWRSHMAEWATITSKAFGAPDSLELNSTPSTGEWNRNDARKVDVYLSNQAAYYLVMQRRPEGQDMARRLVAYMRGIVQDSRQRNGGQIGPSIDPNDWGKNATYKGYCMAYDYMFEYLSQEDPQLLQDYARWLYEQGKASYEMCTSLGEDISNYKHYYKWPWIADGCVGALLTVWGDLPELQSEMQQMLDYILDFKWEDYRARAFNYFGTYSGYREERVEEDLITAALIASCLQGRDPFQEFADHFLNIDDWVMYMTRPNLTMSDETGDKTDLGPLPSYFYLFPYISAVRNRDNDTLWFLDKVWKLLGAGALDEVSEPWVLLFWNDKALARRAPSAAGVPCSRYFGDLTWEDGGNSQYAHFRDQWAFGPGGAESVIATFLCGPITGGHDTFSNGHFSIFRGDDILTTTTGVYDGTAFPHTKYYYEPPISENTILIYDPNSPYADDSELYEGFPHTEGMQAPAPGTTGGGGVYMATDPFDERHEMGHVTKFVCVMRGARQVSRLECDLTSAYPNTRKPDLWPERQLVDAVLRDFLYLAGRYFVVYDRIYATSEEWKKSVVLHSPDRAMPRLLDGSWSGGVQPHPGPYGGTPGVWTEDGSRFYWDYGQSRLFTTVLMPSLETGRRVLAIGGTNSAGEWNQGGSDPSFEFWLRRAGTQYPWSDQYMSDAEIEEQVESGWAGWWRLEVEPAQDGLEDRFLLVLEATSKSQNQPTDVSRIPSDEETVALTIEDGEEPIVIALPLGLGPLQELWYDYQPQGLLLDDAEDRWALHVVDGLEPGTYVVLREGVGSADRVSGGVTPGGRMGAPSEVVYHGTTTDDGLLAFRTPGSGRFVVRPAEPVLLARW